jgi:hypothetical protein
LIIVIPLIFYFAAWRFGSIPEKITDIQDYGNALFVIFAIVLTLYIGFSLGMDCPEIQEKR